MLDAWLKRTRDWLARAEKLLALPEQEFVLWALGRAIKSNPAQPVAVCVWGEPGSGKSSLIRHVLRQQPDSRHRKIVSAEAQEWAQWLAEREVDGLPAITAQEADVVLCENLQTLHNPRGDGDRLAAWIDQARADGIAVIVTTDRLPSQIEKLSPRLVNRLQGGLLTGIRPLSEESQRRLMQLWSADGIHLPTGLTAGRLKAFANSQAGLEVPVASEEIENSVEMSLDLIAETVARDFQISLADLCSGSRTQQLKIPRGVAMSLARELTPCSLLTIGHYFGCRSHTSVVRSCSRLQELLPEAPSLRQQLQLLRAKLRHDLSAQCG